jgi:hypothetical protein
VALRLARNRGYDFLKIFAKKLAKKWRFLTRDKAKLCKKFDRNMVFEKIAIFAENRQKSQKIVIIASTPGCLDGCFSPINFLFSFS